MTWPTVQLGSVADVQLGKMLSPKAKTGTTAFPYLRNVNVQWGYINLSDLVEMDFDEREQEKFSLRRGDLVVCEGGEPGRCAVVDRDLTGVYFQKALMRVRPRNGSIDTRFLQRFMGFAAQRGTFTRDGNQATIAHFPAVKLNALEVPVPPLAEQRRIADILDKADAIRRKRKEAIALTEELLRSAFLEMFGDPVTNPKGWPVKLLLDLCSAKQWPTIAAGELSGSGYPVFGANGIIGYHDEMNHPEATVLITCRGATCGTINVCLPNSYVTGNSMALDGPDPKIITREYLEWVLRLRGLNDTITGSAQPQITRQSLQKVSFPLPPIQQQRAFETLLRKIGGLRLRLERAGKETEDLFNSLVARAFSGTLRADP